MRMEATPGEQWRFGMEEAEVGAGRLGRKGEDAEGAEKGGEEEEEACWNG